jgi:hypothetical protein
MTTRVRMPRWWPAAWIGLVCLLAACQSDSATNGNDSATVSAVSASASAGNVLSAMVTFTVHSADSARVRFSGCWRFGARDPVYQGLRWDHPFHRARPSSLDLVSVQCRSGGAERRPGDFWLGPAGHGRPPSCASGCYAGGQWHGARGLLPDSGESGQSGDSLSSSAPKGMSLGTTDFNCGPASRHRRRNRSSAGISRYTSRQFRVAAH